MVLILFILIAVIITVIVAVNQTNRAKKGLKKTTPTTDYQRWEATAIPTPMSPMAVAKKYAPEFPKMVTGLRVGITVLALIIGAIGIEYFDESALAYAIAIAIVLNIIILINYGLACLFFRVAVDKGYTSSIYLHAAFWLGGFGYLLIAALPNTYANVPQGAYQPVAQPVVSVPPVQQTQPTQTAQPVQPSMPIPEDPAPVPPPAPVPKPIPAPAAAPQANRCSQCGATNVPLQTVTVNIAGTPRTRSICRVCASRYNR